MDKVSVDLIKKLRELTSAGMSDCKKALLETKCDMEAAVLYLRKKGQKISNSLSDKETSEGMIFVTESEDKNAAAMISLCCQTDFVARMDSVKELGQAIVNLALERKIEKKEDLLKEIFNGKESVEEAITMESGKFKEKIDLRDFAILHSGKVHTYLHHNSQMGTIVSFEGLEEKDGNIGREIAMHITASNPHVITKDQISQDIYDKEFQLAKEKAAESGKPESVVEKIANGMLASSLKDIVLMSQPSSLDPKISVEEFLKRASPKIKVTKFFRFSIK